MKKDIIGSRESYYLGSEDLENKKIAFSSINTIKKILENNLFEKTGFLSKLLPFGGKKKLVPISKELLFKILLQLKSIDREVMDSISYGYYTTILIQNYGVAIKEKTNQIIFSNNETKLSNKTILYCNFKSNFKLVFLLLFLDYLKKYYNFPFYAMININSEFELTLLLEKNNIGEIIYDFLEKFLCEF
jgi:hypothetical protein